jgi:hypothetical protein
VIQRSFDPDSLLLPEDDEEEDPRPELPELRLLLDPSLRLPPLSRLLEVWLRELPDRDLLDWLAI